MKKMILAAVLSFSAMAQAQVISYTCKTNNGTGHSLILVADGSKLIKCELNGQNCAGIVANLGTSGGYHRMTLKGVAEGKDVYVNFGGIQEAPSTSVNYKATPMKCQTQIQAAPAKPSNGW